MLSRATYVVLVSLPSWRYRSIAVQRFLQQQLSTHAGLRYRIDEYNTHEEREKQLLFSSQRSKDPSTDEKICLCPYAPKGAIKNCSLETQSWKISRLRQTPMTDALTDGYGMLEHQ